MFLASWPGDVDGKVRSRGNGGVKTGSRCETRSSGAGAGARPAKHQGSRRSQPLAQSRGVGATIPVVAASATLAQAGQWAGSFCSRDAQPNAFLHFSARPNARHCQGINPTLTATTSIRAYRVIASIVYRAAPSSPFRTPEARVALGPSQPPSRLPVWTAVRGTRHGHITTPTHM